MPPLASLASVTTLELTSRSDRARLQSAVIGLYDFTWRVLRRCGLSSDEADDATQEVFAVLAWKIARAGAPGEGPSRPPLGFVGAALFQWVNPKAWMIALAAIPAFTTPEGDLLAETLVIAAAFALVCFPCTLVWAGLGAGASRLLRTDGALNAFNIAMALLLVASLVPALL